jgi:hypothetical protein
LAHLRAGNSRKTRASLSQAPVRTVSECQSRINVSPSSRAPTTRP